MRGHRRMTSIHGVQGRRKKLAGKVLETALEDWGRREGGDSLGQEVKSGKKAAGVTRGQPFSVAGVSSEKKAGVPPNPEKRKRIEMEMVGKLEKRQKVGWGGWVERNLPYWAAKIMG